MQGEYKGNQGDDVGGQQTQPGDAVFPHQSGQCKGCHTDYKYSEFIEKQNIYSDHCSRSI